MKRFGVGLLLATYVAFILASAFLLNEKTLKAQTVVPPITIQSTIPHTACPVAATGVTSYCFASDGLWESISGAAYTQLGAAVAGGVTSFNGRTGAVVSVTGDYSFTQLSNQPTTVNCGASGCVIK